MPGSDKIVYAGHTAHVVKVQPANRFRAICSCDWVGPNQPYRSAAFQDAIDHVRKVEVDDGRE